MYGCRHIVTADTIRWAVKAARLATGYACSVIACDAEAAIERALDGSRTPDGRPGVSLAMFGFTREKLESAAVNRTAQCVLTCPTTACFNGVQSAEKSIALGESIRYFGDGHQQSRVIGDRRFRRIPVMDGEFLCEDRLGVVKGVGGGNFMIMADRPGVALRAAESAVRAVRQIDEVITPFPGGIARSGSKVGSKYKQLKASTNAEFCPTLVAHAETNLNLDSAESASGEKRPAEESERKSETDREMRSAFEVYEIVIDGFTELAVRRAIRAGVFAACRSLAELKATGPRSKISAGNYGGSLGPFKFPLHEILRSGEGEDRIDVLS
jgi:formylmethanofuran--tetrahydromethanopterin N-formyltransferase